ncbi:MAG: hypothetical protein QNJ54_22325 [Prochloraceae cyanobacterium]|nr:hypothetical protein [Prochloraceae cyanobacterium]
MSLPLKIIDTPENKVLISHLLGYLFENEIPIGTKLSVQLHIMFWFYYGEHKVKEISEIMKISEYTIYDTFHKWEDGLIQKEIIPYCYSLDIKKMTDVTKDKVTDIKNTIHNLNSQVRVVKKVSRGRKPRWKEEDFEYLLEQQKENDYNSRDLSRILAKYRNIKLSPSRIRKIFNSRGIRISV